MAVYGDASLPPTMRLIGVRGEEITLHTRYVPPDDGFIGVAKGAHGLDSPDYDVQTDAYPTIDGEFIRFVRGQGREIMLPIVIYGDSRRHCISRKRELLAALNPKLGTVKLITAEATSEADDVTPDYEDERYIELYYKSGFEGDEGGDNGLHWIKVGIVFKATFPFFRSFEELEYPFLADAAAPTPFFAPPAPTLAVPQGGAWGERVVRLSQEAPFTDTITINNPGDVQDYVTWFFLGPLRGPFELVRKSSITGVPDESLFFSSDFVLGSGESATVNTFPGEQSVESDVAGIDFEIFGTNPNFWSLTPGNNTIQVVVPLYEVDDNGQPTDTPRPPINPGVILFRYRPVFVGM